MKRSATFLEQREQTTIHVLADYISIHIAESWQHMLQTHREKLQNLFDYAGEGAAYGTYAQYLFKPVKDQLNLNDFVSTPSFPGTLTTSVEWGNPEARERWMWSIIKREEAFLGTIVVSLFHDHTCFRIPKSPAVLPVDETKKDKILETISRTTGYSLDDTV
jgi:Family of unknown function (DUF6022)